MTGKRSQQKRTQDQQSQERRFQMWCLLITHAHNLLRHMVTCGMIVALGYFAYRSIDAISGKTTAFDAVLNLIASWNVSQWAAWLACGVLGGGWYRTYKSKQKLQNHLRARVTIETTVDPGRTSSGLDEFGESPKEDVL